MTTQQMQYIIALAEEGSFSAAAKRMFVTQPSISQLIKNMESQIGAPLFERNTYPIRLTPIGQAYLDAAKKMDAITRELENRISEINNLEYGTLTIGTSPFRASCMLPISLSKFKEKYPGIKMNIVTDTIENLKSKLQNGQIDFCIDNDVFTRQIFHIDELATETFYLAVSKDNPFNEGREEFAMSWKDILDNSDVIYQEKYIKPEELKEEAFVVLDSKSEFSDIYTSFFSLLKISPNVSLYASNIETLFHWVNNNLGVGFVPDTLIRYGNFVEHPVYYKLKPPKKKINMFQEQIVVAFNKNHFISLPAREYINQLKELISMGTWFHI